MEAEVPIKRIRLENESEEVTLKTTTTTATGMEVGKLCLHRVNELAQQTFLQWKEEQESCSGLLRVTVTVLPALPTPGLI